MTTDKKDDGGPALEDAIFDRIASITVSNPMVISCGPNTLRSELSERLLRAIAKEAAAAAQTALAERNKP